MTSEEILGADTTPAMGNWPTGQWKYYQEWNKAVFIHWQVDIDKLKQFVPKGLEIDCFEGKAWVSLVAFTMENIRPRYLPAFPLVSNFNEINIRTYVKYKNKSGVYFLSIEGGKQLSCQIAKSLSKLPYRYSLMSRTETTFRSTNKQYKDNLKIKFKTGKQLTEKSMLDKWLTERYALFQDSESSINTFEIHHIEWPVFEIDNIELNLNYPRFENLLPHSPHKVHYSPGVQVIAWGMRNY